MQGKGNIFQLLSEAEQKGDLKRQYGILKNTLVSQQKAGIAELNNALVLTSISAIESLPPVPVCILDQKNYCLSIFQGDKKQLDIPLPKPSDAPAFESVEWRTNSQLEFSVYSVKNPSDGSTPSLELQTNKNISAQPKFGIVLYQDFPGLNISDLHKTLSRGYLENYYYGYTGPDNLNSYPLDLTVSPQGLKVAVSDRGSGSLHIIDLNSNKIINSHKIRETASAKRINSSFSNDGSKLYITDNQTNRLIIIDTETGNLNTLELSVTVAGNIVHSRTGNQLFLIGLTPENKGLSLCICNPENGEINSKFPVKGEAMSFNHDPGDLFAVDLKSKFAVIMSLVNEPVMFTPLLNLISIETGETVNTLSLDHKSKPINIALGEPVKYPENTCLKDTLVREKVVDAATLANLMGVEENQLNIVYNSESLKRSAEIETRGDGTFDAGGDPMQSYSGGGVASEGARTADTEFQKLNSIKVEKKIYEVCIAQFANKTKIELNEEEYPNACDRLKTACTKARNDLVYSDSTKVNISFLVNEHDLEAEVSRAEISSSVKGEENKPSLTIKAVCQECGRPLQGPGDCTFCHPTEAKEEELEEKKEGLTFRIGMDDDPVQTSAANKDVVKVGSLLDKMLEAEKGKAPLSREAILNKMKGNQAVTSGSNDDASTIIIADKTRNQVIEVDRNKQVKWKFGGFGCPPQEKLNQPSRAEKTSEGTVLITDTGNNRVLEVSNDNNIIFSWIDLDQPQSAFMLKNGNILVCEKSRVIELNKQNERVNTFEGLAVPAYAMQLSNGNYLFADKDAGSVSELTADHQEVWKMDDLKGPEYAIKLENGNYLIAESGNNKAIEVNSAKEIIWEFNGKPPRGMKIMFEIPTYLERTAAGNTIILHSNQRKAVEIAPDTSIVWQNIGTSLA